MVVNHHNMNCILQGFSVREVENHSAGAFCVLEKCLIPDSGFCFLGPPYTHPRKPQRMVYYGKMDCHNDYENYIEIVKYVFRDYKRESPLIINTMGWVKGKPVYM